MKDKKEKSSIGGREAEKLRQAPPLTEDEKRVLKRLRREAGYKKKSPEEKKRLDAELSELARKSLERRADETAFAKNVAFADRYGVRKYFKAKWRLLTFVVTASFVLLLVLYVLYDYVLIVDTVEVTGSERYTSEAISSASGISVGDRLYALDIDEEELSYELRKQFPYISSVELKRVIPNKVVIEVTEDEPVFVSEIYGEYALLSAELRVLSLGATEPVGEYIKLVLPEVKNAVAGETIEFYSSLFEVVKKAADAVCSESMRAGTSVVDVSDRFNIWIGYEGRYKLMIGDINDIELKLTLAFEIMKDEIFEGGSKGTVYLDNVSSPSVIIDNGLTFE